MLGPQLLKVESLLSEAKDDLPAFTSFPQVHWRKIQSTNPLERVSKDIKRRVDVLGVSTPEALIQLAGAALVEQHDKWCTAHRHHFSVRSMTLVTTPNSEA